MASSEGKKMRTSRLFVHDNVREILQHRMRGDGEDARYRMSLQSQWLQGKDVLKIDGLAVHEYSARFIPTRMAQSFRI
jgi:hypothetical protein